MGADRHDGTTDRRDTGTPTPSELGAMGGPADRAPTSAGPARRPGIRDQHHDGHGEVGRRRPDRDRGGVPPVEESVPYSRHQPQHVQRARQGDRLRPNSTCRAPARTWPRRWRWPASTSRRTGRPGVKKGIIFETDGTPNYETDRRLRRTTPAPRSTDGRRGQGRRDIEIFTIGFDVGGENCPDGGGSAVSLLASHGDGLRSCTARTATPRTRTPTMITSSANQRVRDLTAVFQAAAAELAGLRSHLVQVYPHRSCQPSRLRRDTITAEPS